MDMKDIVWICVDNLAQDRRRRAQGPTHRDCCGDLSASGAACAPNVPVMSSHNACNMLNLCPTGPAQVKLESQPEVICLTV